MKYIAILAKFDPYRHILTNDGIKYEADNLNDLQNAMTADRENGYKLISVRNNETQQTIYSY